MLLVLFLIKATVGAKAPPDSSKKTTVAMPFQIK
jgi:hypothetical protein